MKRLVVPGAAVELSRIGFGCARLYAGADLKMSAKLIETALEHGIRHFDTAPSYGAGASEDALGQVLSGEKGVTIATKVGMRVLAATNKPSGSLYRRTLRPLLSMMPGVKASLLTLRAQLRPKRLYQTPPQRRAILEDEIHDSLQASLKRLRRTQIDILLLHEPDYLDWPPETVETLEALVKSGVIGAFGLAYGGKPDGRRLGAVTQARFDQDSLDYGATHHVHLVHSVLRPDPTKSPNRSASEKIAAALNLSPGVGVVFSASSANQIRDIMQGPAGAAVAGGSNRIQQ